jgi:putative flippase GtrA
LSVSKQYAVDFSVADRENHRHISMRAGRRFLDAFFMRATDRVGLQFLRYLLVGGIATVFDFGAFVLLIAGGIHYLLANGIAFAIGVSVNYVLSVLWVFSSRAMDSRIVEFLIFVLVGVAGLGISEACMFVGVDIVHFHYTMAKLGAIACALIWNFAARKLLLFRGSSFAAQAGKQLP